MGKCRGMSSDFSTVLKYAKRKYRMLGYFTIFHGTVRNDWFVLPYSDLKTNDVILPFVFKDKRWQQVR